MTRRSRGQPAGLSRDRIADAAVDLVDRHGLAAFGVRRLAAELGVDPMSIYNHIKGKAALLDAISEAVVTEATAASAAWPDDWMDVAREMARGYRDMAIRHPRVFPLLATRAQTSATALEAVERLTAAMRRAELADQTIADAPLVLFGFLNGYLLATLKTDPVGADEPATGAAQPDFYPAHYPTLASLSPLQAGFGGDTEFERMLETVLSGIATTEPSQC
ncbi:MAG TPA: TetR/AcrR family transcriptional regulator C-terminal domain-containing protein [Intrasporangium sp.]|uniref:TetR/AcrR family transcriptional regulator n=1 Tax=Intrasporangium sp. TaxID=1925024 RepID=UPI002B47E8AE|nr:TetR/AcrR family transcriptional regulator C-terminal domain-containing protein [Intrasporangium sp.]HKX66491.1 TetR/AcrR family transcriptional regulator C-terminal domain-containing protein [Intrasporangium sp.]